MSNSNKTSGYKGVMFNAYPDSIGNTLSDTVSMLQMPAFKDVFSLFYILPTFFNSDLDRGFSIIDYNLNKNLVSEKDLVALGQLNIALKFDIVLNHLSVASPQFKDLLANGEDSKYKDFFINWNAFWDGHGEKNADGIVIPKAKFLNKLFMRKSGLPILKVPFKNGAKQPYWNTFYQQIRYQNISENDLDSIKGLTSNAKKEIVRYVNKAIENKVDIDSLEFNNNKQFKSQIIEAIEKKCSYLGQMDVNAKSELVWDFYEETLANLKRFGCKILRLDAFAYLHKAVGETNFFNTPGTWQHLERINKIAQKNDLILLPEIHAEYGLNLHDEVAEKGYTIYDFFLPGLMIHTLENRSNKALYKWLNVIITKGYKTINMLGCHDGIPVLDLKGKTINGVYKEGLLTDVAIEAIMNTIIDRGGRVKNLYDPSGKKISYYQVNATFFSALGEDEDKFLLARAIQLFIPGIPQIWYLDLFAGKNNYEAADNAGADGHKEINRTTLTIKDVEDKLQTTLVKNQLQLIKLRNTSQAFSGTIKVIESSEQKIEIIWTNKADFAHLQANLQTQKFNIIYTENNIEKMLKF